MSTLNSCACSRSAGRTPCRPRNDMPRSSIRSAWSMASIVGNRLIRVIRPAGEGDLEVINDIYNHYVAETHVTFDDEPMEMETRREWFSHYAETGRHRLLIAAEDGQVIGYASSSRFRPKPGYLTSVETSIYLAPDAVGKGAGSKLYAELFRALEAEDLHRAYAGI